MEYPVESIRAAFPSLASGAVFFDGPGGTQVPQAVIDAVGSYYRESNANEHGPFAASRRSDEAVAEGRRAMADFLNARSPDEIVFGANMTTLTLHLARALGRDLGPGDEIVVTRLDHDANIAPWLHLEERGVVVRWLEFIPDDCTLDLSGLERRINERTRLVAVGAASNAFGTINDMPRIIAAAKQAGALTFVDAVHYAPHRPIDVQRLDCDFLACSPYKFYGPHSGVLYGKREALERLRPYKVRPSRAAIPDGFETGTKSHEAIAGVAAAVDFLSAIGDPARNGSGRRQRLPQALAAVMEHESRLFRRLMDGLLGMEGLRLYGIADPGRLDQRTPTACFNLSGIAAGDVARRLGAAGIQVWDGDYYAWEAMRFLGLGDKGGAVRAGICLYNDESEVDRFLHELGRIARAGSFEPDLR
ncbi:MAG: cysteine desulfurase-like protein [Candidatus Aminicenantes bacterium]|nr:cysteine desulfurase-like protein [Candidatus Aminicenantes bacterium]